MGVQMKAGLNATFIDKAWKSSVDLRVWTLALLKMCEIALSEQSSADFDWPCMAADFWSRFVRVQSTWFMHEFKIWYLDHHIHSQINNSNDKANIRLPGTQIATSHAQTSIYTHYMTTGSIRKKTFTKYSPTVWRGIYDETKKIRLMDKLCALRPQWVFFKCTNEAMLFWSPASWHEDS